MRRPLCALVLIASSIGAASISFAQDSQPDAGTQPSATLSASATATATATAPVTVTAPPPPPVTPPPTSTVSEQEPLRLGRLIELEAERARSRRYGNAAVKMILGGGEILTGGLIFTIDTTGYPSGLATVLDFAGVVSMVIGGLGVLDGVISLFVTSPMERLFDQYAPIAIDKNLSASERLHRGEQMLEAMAMSEKGQRTVGAVGSMISAAILTGFAIFVGADNDLWAGDSNALFDRVIFSTAFAVGAIGTLTEGIGSLVWERGAAEVAWEHWHAAHEVVTVQTSRLHFAPSIVPVRGGVTAGMSLRF